MKFVNSKNIQNIIISISSNNMSLFTIDISTLLHSPVGTMEEFQFNQDIPVDTFEDVICTQPLDMHIKLVREEYWIRCIFSSLQTQLSIPSEGIEEKTVELHSLSREFHIKKKSDDTDDIEYIDSYNGTINLSKVIEQELLIGGM